MWSMVAQRLTQITPPAATPDQLWRRVEAAWSAVPQEHIQSLFESMPRRVAARHRGSVLHIKRTQSSKLPVQSESCLPEVWSFRVPQSGTSLRSSALRPLVAGGILDVHLTGQPMRKKRKFYY
ncbi:transposable element Tcb1 transposase [Trichonephila clavipes]|nr:transposable element Tcb1 transposase [Trichonephila clavipes]